MKLIEVSNLTKKYGNFTALDNLSMDIYAGQLTAFLGTNGAGKSTTINLLTGIQQPTSGKIDYNESYSKDIGIVFQNSILDNKLTVWQNLATRAYMYKHITIQDLENLMSQTGVNQFSHKRYGDLSGGMKRKVDITRALINHPTLIFLDEPTTGLDAQSRIEIWQLLKELQQTKNLAIFLTTHYLEEAEYADNIYILQKGQLIAHGSANTLKKTYGEQLLWVVPSTNSSFLNTLEFKNYQIDKYKGIGIPVQNYDEAILLLNKYHNQILDFSFQPITLSEVFIQLTKEV
ncbi:hypothetical protein BW731_01005 [Vagococcus martis]|uniref:ABC transporter domain-containing protein n=1 Tax=Vagococcus martis TaxID=1768210 RepID=A0A1V4DEG4_9ENTE|nr:ABC transporter ATP-binding protein [Vagococcus martis]OPF86877.1 hypothetical protein BW731_01005 [Vagococcus martis]